MATDAIAEAVELDLEELEAELATLPVHLYAGTCGRLELACALTGGPARAVGQRLRCGVGTGAGSAEPRPARQASRAEALVALAEAALAQPQASRPGGERYQTYT